MAHSSSSHHSERSIHEMLKDTPPMNESNSAIHSGIEGRVNKQHPNSLPFRNNSGEFCTVPQQMSIIINPFVTSTAPTTPTPLSPSSSYNGDATTFLRSGASKIDTIKNWSISTYKCTRQLMLEKLGKSTRTVDSELEAQIEQLRDTQRKYLQILRLTRALSSHFHHVVQTQLCLSEAFSDLAQKSPELQEEFLYNSETQRSLTKNGELLLSALNFFVSSVNTLCNKTIEDTLITIRQYEIARIEYDAYRMDLENSRPDAAVAAATATQVNGDETQKSFAKHKETYEKLRADVAIKMQFLDENRVSTVLSHSHIPHKTLPIGTHSHVSHCSSQLAYLKRLR